jgi:hypothetical protein
LFDAVTAKDYRGCSRILDGQSTTRARRSQEIAFTPRRVAKSWMEAMEEAPELLGNIAQVKKADGNIRRTFV